VLVDRGHVDDAPAASLRDEPPRRRLRADERTGEVNLQHVAPVRQLDIEKRRGVAGPGVVDEDVQPAERVGELVDDSRAGRGVAEVERADDRLGAGVADLGRGALRTGLVAVPRDPDVESALGEQHGGRPADAGV
jgi:hypothetical protein